jgi:hypothetical protein
VLLEFFLNNGILCFSGILLFPWNFADFPELIPQSPILTFISRFLNFTHLQIKSIAIWSWIYEISNKKKTKMKPELYDKNETRKYDKKWLDGPDIGCRFSTARVSVGKSNGTGMHNDLQLMVNAGK